MLAKVVKRDGQLIVNGSETEGVLRVEPTRLVVLSRDKLMAAADR